MSPGEITAKWIKRASADDLRALAAFLIEADMGAAILAYQYATDPAGTPGRYGIQS